MWWGVGWERGGQLTEEKAGKVLYGGEIRKGRGVALEKWYGVRLMPYR